MSLFSRLRIFRNTYFPLPICFRSRRLLIGDNIFRKRASIWEQENYHKVDSYLRLDDAAHTLLDRVKSLANCDDAILDVCCNVGRHLNSLAQSWYTSLSGFDIMEPAIKSSKTTFPLLERADLRLGNIVDVLPAYQNESFDWSFNHSATIENVHPSFPIHHQMYRLVRKGCIFLINTEGHFYPRNYKHLFESAGFVTLSETSVPSVKDYSFTLYTWVKKSYIEANLLRKI